MGIPFLLEDDTHEIGSSLEGREDHEEVPGQGDHDNPAQ